MRCNVLRIPGDEIGVFLHALRIVAGHHIEVTSRAVPFTLRHAIEVTDGFLHVLLSILLLVEVPRRHTQGCPGEAELRITLHSLQKTASRFIEPAVRHGFHRHGIVMYRLQRGGRKRFHGEALRGV